MSTRISLIGAFVAAALAGPALADGITNPGSSSGGSSTITANSTATSGFAANTLVSSDGSKAQPIAPCASGVLGYSSGSVPSCSATLPSPLNFNSDLYWQRDAAGVYALSNGAADTGTVTNPAAQRIYNIASSSLTNYERMEIGFAAHSNVAAIDVAAGGTGAVRPFGIYVGGSQTLALTTTGGASLYLGTATVGANTFVMQSDADNVFFNTPSATGIFDYAFQNGNNLFSMFSTGQMRLGSAGAFGFASGTSSSNNALDTILTRAAAANWQFGAANAASPVAQTLSFQGASNAGTNGASATIVGSLAWDNAGGTNSGDIIFQTGVKQSAAQATATTALTIKGETQAVLTAGTLTVGTVNSATGLFVCETAGLLSSGITTCVASDRAVKHDIATIDDGDLLDKVLGQRGVRFTYNEAKGAPGRRIGVIANDWEKNFPELVDFDTDGIRHFDYAATWGLSVEMFRALRADNDNLRAEVEALRRSIAR